MNDEPRRRKSMNFCVTLERVAGGVRSTIQLNYQAQSEYLAKAAAEKEMPGWKVCEDLF